MGQGVHLETGFLGCGSFIGENTRVVFTSEIGRFVTIGENCLIGARVPEDPELISTSYPVREKDLPWCRDWLPVKEPWKKKGPIQRTVIGNDVFIGDRCVIPQGIKVGDGAFLYPVRFQGMMYLPMESCGEIPDSLQAFVFLRKRYGGFWLSDGGISAQN